MAFRGASFSLLGEVVEYSWFLYFGLGSVVWVLAFSSHFGRHLLGGLQVLKPDLPWIYLFDFLILIRSILPFHFFHLLLIVDLLNDLQKLFAFLLVNPRQVPFFHSFLDELLDLLLLFHGDLSLFFFFVDVVCSDLEVGLVLALLFLLLHLDHALVLLHSFSSLSLFLAP